MTKKLTEDVIKKDFKKLMTKYGIEQGFIVYRENENALTCLIAYQTCEDSVYEVMKSLIKKRKNTVQIPVVSAPKQELPI